jgi:hypothetical protein
MPDKNIPEQNTEDLLTDRTAEQDSMVNEMADQMGQTVELSADSPLVKGKKAGDTVQIGAVIDKIENGTATLTVQE